MQIHEQLDAINPSDKKDHIFGVAFRVDEETGAPLKISINVGGNLLNLSAAIVMAMVETPEIKKLILSCATAYKDAERSKAAEDALSCFQKNISQ